MALVALADEPRRQTQYPVGWDLDEGNLLLFGIPGSGTTTALASLALSLAAAASRPSSSRSTRSTSAPASSRRSRRCRTPAR